MWWHIYVVAHYGKINRHHIYVVAHLCGGTFMWWHIYVVDKSKNTNKITQNK